VRKILGLLILFFGIAVAQGAPAPIGYWTTDDGSETLLIEQSGTCKFAGGKLVILGRCSWNPSSRGGILTIMNVYNYKPAPIYYNIVWVDRRTIRVYGDVFHRRY